MLACDWPTLVQRLCWLVSCLSELDAQAGSRRGAFWRGAVRPGAGCAAAGHNGVGPCSAGAWLCLRVVFGMVGPVVGAAWVGGEKARAGTADLKFFRKIRDFGLSCRSKHHYLTVNIK